MIQLFLKKKIKIHVETARPSYFTQNTVLTCEIIEEEEKEQEEVQKNLHEQSIERLRNSNISSCENSHAMHCQFQVSNYRFETVNINLKYFLGLYYSHALIT